MESCDLMNERFVVYWLRWDGMLPTVCHMRAAVLSAMFLA